MMNEPDNVEQNCEERVEDVVGMYHQMLNGPDDLVGAIAYAIYKRKKQGFIDQVNAKYHRAPTLEEYEGFNLSHCGDSQRSDYRAEATRLFDMIISEKLAAVSEAIVRSERESMLSETLGEVKGVLAGSIANFGKVEEAISETRDELAKKKGAAGWLRDCLSVVASTLLVILFIGLLGLGQQIFDKVTAKAEHSVSNGNLSQNSASSKDQSPARATTSAFVH